MSYDPLKVDIERVFDEIPNDLQRMTHNKSLLKSQPASRITSKDKPFGNVYLGETLSLQVNFHNKASFQMQDMIIKIDIQTNHTRSHIQEESFSATLLPTCSHQTTTKITTQELGVHVLAITTTFYNPTTDEQKLTRNFFKFSVENPMSLRTKYTLVTSSVYLEAQLRNVSVNRISLFSVIFESIAPLRVSTINYSIKDESQELSASAAEYKNDDLYLDPGSVYQFVFKFGSLPAFYGHKLVKLGRLDLNWQTCQGDKGRLQTNIINFYIPTTFPPHPISFDVKRRDESVPLYPLKPCPHTITLHNHSDKSVKIKVYFDLESISESTTMQIFAIGQTEYTTEITANNSSTIEMDLMVEECGWSDSNDAFTIHEFSDDKSNSQIFEKYPITFSLFAHPTN